MAQAQLHTLAEIDEILPEASAVEMVDSILYWTIQDAGNENTLYALNSYGKIVKSIVIENAKNDDWEDLTSDNFGNIYIGDFGNNSEKRKQFTILKIKKINLSGQNTTSEKIIFTLPKKMKSKDFEAFFLFNENFYIFSKEKKDAIMIKVPNKTGKHEAVLIAEFELDGKDTEITSADISPDGSTVALLNHDKIWILKQFKGNNFFEGKIKDIDLDHDSQKEGIYFKNNNILIISDERDKDEGGFIYKLKI
tara:strand:- start:15636 stop:16388 length:753 start_codon:yes stop_codon:yes gene_type:complete